MLSMTRTCVASPIPSLPHIPFGGGCGSIFFLCLVLPIAWKWCLNLWCVSPHVLVQPSLQSEPHRPLAAGPRTGKLLCPVPHRGFPRHDVPVWQETCHFYFTGYVIPGFACTIQLGPENEGACNCANQHFIFFSSEAQKNKKRAPMRCKSAL